MRCGAGMRYMAHGSATTTATYSLSLMALPPVVGYRFGYAEDTVQVAAALKPALAARGVPVGLYFDNGSAFVNAWLLRTCAKPVVRLVHSMPHRPRGRGKIARY